MNASRSDALVFFGQERLDQRIVGAQGGLQQVVPAVERNLLLALLDHGPDACRSQYAAEARPAGTDALDESSLGHEVHLRLAFDHQLLGLRVEADMSR